MSEPENQPRLRGDRRRTPGHQEPVAVVGMACRLPGGIETPQELWAALCEGRDLTGPLPADRFRGAERWRGGALGTDVAAFDARYFDVPPNAADVMDPQIRLLLEVAVDALEDAGVDCAAAAPGGAVYAGVAFTEYRERLARRNAPPDPYFICETNACSAAGRLSHHLGFQGPSLTLNAACSSSALAIHLACRDLATGEADLALAGGANLFLSADTFAGFAALKVLAPDGRCKAFGDAADGYGRAEGVGIVCLRRLADALADGDRVLAVIESTAVVNDGAGARYTAPNASAQVAAIHKALARAGLLADDIDVIEAHGTGTRLGDRVEMLALGQAMAERSPALPAVLVGSLKTNMGHAEAAAGVASLIKMVMALREGAVPAHIATDRPAPHLNAPDTLAITPDTVPWPGRGQRPRRAGINTFGMSGVNVHIVLSEPPYPPGTGRSPDITPARQDEPMVLAISAQSPTALASLGKAWLKTLEGLSADEARIHAAASAHRRTALSHRIAVSGRSADELRGRLALRLLALQDEPTDSARLGSRGHAPALVFVCASGGCDPDGFERILACDPGVRSIASELYDEAVRVMEVGGREFEHDTTHRAARIRAVIASVVLARALAAMAAFPAIAIDEAPGTGAAAVVLGHRSLPDAIAELLAAQHSDLAGGAARDPLSVASAAAFDALASDQPAIVVHLGADAMAPLRSRQPTSDGGLREVVMLSALSHDPGASSPLFATRLRLHELGISAPSALLAPEGAPWRCLPRTPWERTHHHVPDTEPEPPVARPREPTSDKPRRGSVASEPLTPKASGDRDEADDLLGFVASAVARVVGKTSAEIDPDVSFASLGIDSLSAVTLAAALSRGGQIVQPTVLFSHPTVRRLAQALGTSAPQSPPRPAPEQHHDELVAAEDALDALLEGLDP